jgi:nucleoside-diphosphate-sugar epimerase
VVTIRPFNTFGPRQSARAFIPAIMSQVLSCDAVRLGALSPRRDMTYVADTVDGFLRAAVMTDILGDRINLGSGEAFSIGELTTRILRLMGCSKPIVHDAARDRPEKSEVMNLVSDNRKAARLMQWKPATSLDDGLRSVIEFVSMHPELYTSEGYIVRCR